MAKAAIAVAIHPCMSESISADSQLAMAACRMRRTHAGKLKTSSANEIRVSKRTLVHITTGTSRENNAHETKIPDIIPNPPVRGIAFICSERSLGWSRTLRTRGLWTRYRTTANVTVNATGGAKAIANERPAVTAVAYSLREFTLIEESRSVIAWQDDHCLHLVLHSFRRLPRDGGATEAFIPLNARNERACLRGANQEYKGYQEYNGI